MNKSQTKRKTPYIIQKRNTKKEISSYQGLGTGVEGKEGLLVEEGISSVVIKMIRTWTVATVS